MKETVVMHKAVKVGVVVATLVVLVTPSRGYVAGIIALAFDPNPRGGIFENFNFPVINESGHVAFIADEPGGTLPTLYRYDHDTASVSTVFEFGSPLNTSNGIAINDRGDIAFGQVLSLVRWNNGVTTEIARIGDPTPLGGTFIGFQGLPQGALNNNGELVFLASFLTNAGSTSVGIFVGDGVNIRAVAADGDPTPVGGTFTPIVGLLCCQWPLVNESGDVLFWGKVLGGTAGDGLFLSRGGVLQKVMAAGEATPIGSMYAENPGGNLHSISESGEVAFHAFLDDGRQALFRWNDGVTTKVVSSDDISPLGNAFAAPSHPVLNSAGALAFSAQGPLGPVLYVEYRGVIDTILSGSEPPGVLQGLLFDFNDRGDFVVRNQGNDSGGLFFLRAEADVTATKSDNPDPVTAGSPLTYTVVLTNNGPDLAFGVTLADTLPASVTFVSSATTQGSCTGTNSVACEIGTLTPGATATVTIVVTPTAEGGLLNTVTLTSLALDNVPANNTDSEATAVAAPPPPPPPPPGVESVGGWVTGLGSIHVECRNLSRRRRETGAFVVFDLPPGVTSWDCEAQGLIVSTGDRVEIRVTAIAK